MPFPPIPVALRQVPRTASFKYSKPSLLPLRETNLTSTFQIWDSESGLSLETLKGHTAAVLDIQFSSDGAYFASAAEDRLVKVWSASTLEEVMTFTGKYLKH